MDNTVLNTISLCTGVAMLDEGVHAGLEYLGIRSRTVVYAEREAFPVSVLAARMEEGSLAPAPVWFGDFTELPAGRFRGVVDGVVAGFPCQDLSVAGRRAGLDGKRSGLFFNVLDIADASGAWFLVLENVAGIASATASVVDEEEGELEERAAARVMGELADRGWHAEWITLSASDVGASHGRARWFCFAWRMADAGLQHGDLQQRRARGEHPRGCIAMDDAECAERRAQRVGGAGGVQGHDGGWREAHRGAGVADQALADTEDDHGRRELQSGSARGGRAGLAGTGDELADADSARLQGISIRGGADQNGRQITHGSTGECRSIFAPGPSDAGWPGILARFPWLAPAIAEQEAESMFCGMADGLPGFLDGCINEAKLTAQDGAAAYLATWRSMQQVQLHSFFAAPSSGLQPASASGDSVRLMPCEASPRGESSILCDLQERVPANQNGEEFALWQSGLLERAWAAICRNQMGGSPENETVRIVRDGVCLYEGEANHLRSILWQRISMEKTQRNRTPRLRACGNGVVPLCAASAVVVLVRRSGLFAQSAMTDLRGHAA